MKYCVNILGSLLYLLKEILNFVTFFTFLIFQVFSSLEIHNFQYFLGTLLFDILFWFLDLHGLYFCYIAAVLENFLAILLSEMLYLTLIFCKYQFLYCIMDPLFSSYLILTVCHFFLDHHYFFFSLASKSLCCFVDSHSFFNAHLLVFLVWYILVGHSGKLWPVVDQLGSWMK